METIWAATSQKLSVALPEVFTALVCVSAFLLPLFMLIGFLVWAGDKLPCDKSETDSRGPG